MQAIETFAKTLSPCAQAKVYVAALLKTDNIHATKLFLRKILYSPIKYILLGRTKIKEDEKIIT